MEARTWIEPSIELLAPLHDPQGRSVAPRGAEGSYGLVYNVLLEELEQLALEYLDAVRGSLGLDPLSDARAVLAAGEFLGELRERGVELLGLGDVCDELHGRRVLVLTSGSCLEHHLSLLGAQRFDVIVAADGAANPALLELGRCPDIVVSDLDGGWWWYSRCVASSLPVIHIHGDNVWLLPLLDPLPPRIACTAQHASTSTPCRLVPGFTDGDRAVLLPVLCGAAEVVVAGWCPGEPQHPGTKPSYLYDRAWKTGKLGVARVYLAFAERLCERVSCRLYTLGGDGLGELA